MKITILRAGYCTCPEHIAMQGGRWNSIRFPAMFVLLEHPRFGPILYDTGYSYHFFEETKYLPNRLYQWMTPVSLNENELAVNQLIARNYHPDDISYIIISHFHADHIAALKDFKRAQFIYLPRAVENLNRNKGFASLSKAILPGLIPNDFFERARPIDINKPYSLPPEYFPFNVGYDLFGDNSIFGVELPGHAKGQLGIISSDNKQNYFFVADAAWLGQAIQENRRPHRITNLLFSDPPAYEMTLQNLQSLQQSNPKSNIIPSHCEKTLDKFTT